MMRSLPCPAQATPGAKAPEACSPRLFLAAGRRDFGCEIGFLLFDSFAESIAHKAGNLHRRADLALGFLDGLRDRLALFVMDEGLLQQAAFLVIGLQTRLDDLLDHVVGLALL